MLFIVLAILSALLFGAATPISKALLSILTPFQLAGLLYLGAAAGLLPVLVAQRSLRPIWRLDRANRIRLLGAVILGGICGPLALLFGLRMAAAASVAMWLNLELVATALLGHFFFRDHLGRYGWLASAGALAASALLSWDGGMAGVGAGCLVGLACICWGFDNHFTALIDGITPSESTFWKGLIAGSVNLAIGAGLSPYQAGGEVTLQALIVGALSYGASIVLYITAAQHIGATRGQIFFSSAPFWGVGLAVLLLGESFSALQLIAAVLLIVALALLTSEGHKHSHEHAENEHEHWHRHSDGHHEHVHTKYSSWLGHSHVHSHDRLHHTHAHWPDLHHRHLHEEKVGE